MAEKRVLKRKSEMKATPLPVKKKARGHGFQKGNKMGKGRPKGSLNKFTKDIKQMMLNALNDERVEGEEGFINWILASNRNKELFYTWLQKQVPANVTLEGDLPIVFEISEKFMPKKGEKDARK